VVTVALPLMVIAGGASSANAGAAAVRAMTLHRQLKTMRMDFPLSLRAIGPGSSHLLWRARPLNGQRSSPARVLPVDCALHNKKQQFRNNLETSVAGTQQLLRGQRL
jgi:hypothetical protein